MEKSPQPLAASIFSGIFCGKTEELGVGGRARSTYVPKTPPPAFQTLLSPGTSSDSFDTLRWWWVKKM